MKHNVKITLIILAMFMLAQIIGLTALQQKIDPVTKEMSKSDTVGPFEFESPKELDNDFGALYIVGAIIIGTLMVLMIVKFNKPILWKLWFLCAVLICLTLAFVQFVDWRIAIALAALLAIGKIFRPGIIVSNITELFIYSGLAVIFVPVLNILTAFVLLILISAYDKLYKV